MCIKKVGIILRKNSTEPKQVANELTAWLADRCVATFIDRVDPDFDLLIILGGDGTLLHVAGQASRYRIPVVGINLGDLGFLTEVAKDERFTVLEDILACTMNIEERMMLKVRLVTDHHKSDWDYALNDVVVSKGRMDRLVQLSTMADHDYITTYRADGLIFSTPTGATAYNLSAGGPIVHPSLNSILVTPICPFMLDSRPVLLAPDTKLTTRLIGGPRENVKVIVDGKATWDMRHNDMLEVCAAENPLQLIGSSEKDYFEILRNKLNWGSIQDRSSEHG